MTPKSALGSTIAAFFALAGCVVLAACAMQPITPEKAAQYKRVGVLSAMGDRFGKTAVGITVFQNEDKSHRFDLGADDILTRKLRETLSTKYTVVDLSRYRAAFRDTPKYWPGGNKVFGENRPPVEEVVRRLMGAEALDAYILVTPGGASVGGTNQRVGGIGVFKRALLLSSDTFWLHAAYVISVIDGKDWAVVAEMRALPIGQSRLISLNPGGPFNIPNLRASSEWWDAPTQHREEIGKAFEQLMDRSIPETLRRAALIE